MPKQKSSIRVVFNLTPQLIDALPDRAHALVSSTALRVEADAKRRCPVLTGTLRRSIHTVWRGLLTALVGTDVFYAPYVEYGTRRMPARPYLTPAAEAAASRFADEAKDLCDLGGLHR